MRQLRGERSQAALSRWLRYRSNVVYLWEQGRRYPTAAGFFWLAQRCGVDVEAQLDRFLTERGDHGPASTPAGAAGFLRDLRGSRKSAALARDLGLSKHAIGRWMRGETEPRLPEFLHLVEGLSRSLLDFVALFADPAELPSVSEAWRRTLVARRLLREEPWAPAILLALELDAYQALEAHQPGWIAARLRLPEEVEARCLALLEDVGQIVRRGGRYSPVATQTVNLAPRERKWDLRQWWSSVANERLVPEMDGLASWNLFTVSQADYERLKVHHVQYFRELRSIVAESQGEERVVLANVQLIALDEEG